MKCGVFGRSRERTVKEGKGNGHGIIGRFETGWFVAKGASEGRSSSVLHSPS